MFVVRASLRPLLCSFAESLRMARSLSVGGTGRACRNVLEINARGGQYRVKSTARSLRWVGYRVAFESLLRAKPAKRRRAPSRSARAVFKRKAARDMSQATAAIQFLKRLEEV